MLVCIQGKFGVNKKDNTKFLIGLRGLFNLSKITFFHLFSPKEGDKFIGISYGFNKNLKPINFKINENEQFTLKRCFFVEFRFKIGSVLLYLKGLHELLQKENKNNYYYETFLANFLKLEKGILKWIEKKQK